MHWSQIPDFRGIDLQDSWVLEWVHRGDTLRFKLDASIWPASHHYESPKPGDHTCYKLARLSFEEFDSLKGLNPMSAVRPAIGGDGQKDFGSIDELWVREFGFEISGEFGNVVVSGGSMKFEIET